MKLTKLDSSNLEGCHYDGASRVLTVKFKSGGTYKYAGCSPKHHQGLLDADSPGKYLAQHIKGRFDATKHETG